MKKPSVPPTTPSLSSGARRSSLKYLAERRLAGEGTVPASVRRWRIARFALLSVLALASDFVTGATTAQEPSIDPQPAFEFTVQTGHTANIEVLEYAPNGRFFVTAAKDSTIKLWSPAGTLIRTIRSGIWADYLAISHDSQILLAASRMGNILMFSLDGRVLRRLPDVPTREAFISAVALSDDNQHIAIGTTKGLVLYRLDGAADTRLTADGDTSEAHSLLFTRDNRLLSGHSDGKICFWTNEGKLLRTVAAHEYPVRTLSLSPDGRTVVSAGVPVFFGEIPKNIKPVAKLWDLEGNAAGQFASQFTQSMRFGPDGAYLVSGGRSDNRIIIYGKSGEPLRSIGVGTTGHRSPYLVAPAPDGRTLVAADDSIDPPGLAILSVEGGVERSLFGLSGPMTNVATSPDGSLIVTLSADRFVRIWSVTGRLIASLAGHKEYPTGLAYAPNGMMFASGGSEVIVWTPLGEKIREFSGFRDGAGSLAFSPDSRFLFCADGGGTVHIYGLEDKSVRHVKVHDGRAAALAIHPSGKYFATGSYREEVRTWDMDGKLLGQSRFEGKATRPVGPAYSLAFSPDGERLVAATTNPEKSLQIFDLKAQLVDSINVANSHQGGAIAFSPSGQWLAATTSSAVTIWDWPTRKIARVLKGHNDFIAGLTFMPDSVHLVSAGHDATTRVWRLDNGYSMALMSHGGDWINFTPDGYFDASHYGGDLVAMTRGLDTFGVDQFALRLNRPDIILARLGLGTPEFIEHLQSRYQRRLERSGFQPGSAAFSLEAPEVRLLEAAQDGKFARIDAQISDPHFPLQSYQIYINNVPIFPGQGKPAEGSSVRVSERIELGEGDNKIEISAFDRQGVEALRAHWSASYRPDPKEAKHDLYFIGFGVSHYQNPALNLQFAHKDVLDLAAALQRYGGAFRRVAVKTYVDEAVTPENMLKAGEFLKGSGVDDIVVVLVSGHGAYDLSKEATYYYGTYNIDPKNLATSAVSFEQIESLLRDIAPRRKLLLLDTCESGEMDEATRAELAAKARGAGLSARTSQTFQVAHAGQPRRVFLYERDRYIYNDLARRTGSIIFSASHAGEMSFESPKIQNGLFTREVIDALSSSQADTNRDGRISIDEIEAFVSFNVASKTGGLQRPIVDRDNINQRFSFPLQH